MQIDPRIGEYLYTGDDGGLFCEARLTPKEILDIIAGINADHREMMGEDLIEVIGSPDGK